MQSSFKLISRFLSTTKDNMNGNDGHQSVDHLMINDKDSSFQPDVVQCDRYSENNDNITICASINNNQQQQQQQKDPVKSSYCSIEDHPLSTTTENMATGSLSTTSPTRNAHKNECLINNNSYNNQLNNDSSNEIQNSHQFERYSQWIYCIAVVNFDIEIGQSIECIFPKSAYLTEKEISSICYLSFPDSNSGCMGDTQFYFRTKTCSDKRPYFDKYYKDFNSRCLSLLEVEKSYFYGFVYFRQVKDRNARRGYFQKSLVLLTWFPFVPLFSRIMKTLAPQYFEFGLPSLEAACSDINRWPAPRTDQILNLALFGTVTQVLIPGEKHSSSMCQITTSAIVNNTLMFEKTTFSPLSSPNHYNHQQNGNNNNHCNNNNNNHHHHLSLRPLSLLRLSKKSYKSNANHDFESSSSSSAHNTEAEGPDFNNETNKNHGSTVEWSNNNNNNNNNDDNNQLNLQLPSSTFTNNSIVNVANDINIYKNLLPVIAHVQLLWELVLTNEPIAVITQTPNVCSEIVTSFVNLIAPFRYGADYRPFFTIHDSEFKEYTSHAKSPPPVILGVTNPFFVKTLQDWPHLVKINEFPLKNGHKKSVNIDAGLKVNSNKSLDIKTGVYTKYKPFLQKDREILKKLLKGIESNRPSEAQNAILRRFLIELTQSFSIPLERYFASLMPLAKNLSPFKRPPILHHFKIEEFIKSLDATGPHLTSVVKGDWTGLYRRFLRSPNFVCWYNSRLKEANNKIMSLHLETIGDTNLANLLNDKPEIEIVDLILKLKDDLKCASNEELQISSETVEKIRYNMDKIIDKLPEDSRLLFETKFTIDKQDNLLNNDDKNNG